jgi:uncharacterized protein
VQPFDKLRASGFFGAVALFLALWLAIPAYAQKFPPLTGRVVDAANLFTPEQRTRFDAKLAAVEQSTGRQFVIATIPDMQGYDLSDYGYRLGRAWGIGQKGKNNGVVLFVAPNEGVGQRGPRLEVGYGLEPILTDAFSSIVTMSVMTPMLRNGDIEGAFNKGIDIIAEQIKLTPEEAASRTAELQNQSSSRSSSDSGIPGGIIFWIFIFLFVILPLLRGFGGRRHRGSTGIGDVILWTAINAAVNSRDNDGGGWGGGGGFGGGGGGGGFSGGGGSFGGGGASGGW